MIILLLFSQKVEYALPLDNWLSKALAYVGRISFGIYLTHIFVIIALSYVMSVNMWFLRWLLAVAASILLVSALRAILPLKLKQVIGVA